jgi:hypothetical protein
MSTTANNDRHHVQCHTMIEKTRPIMTMGLFTLGDYIFNQVVSSVYCMYMEFTFYRNTTIISAGKPPTRAMGKGT